MQYDDTRSWEENLARVRLVEAGLLNLRWNKKYTGRNKTGQLETHIADTGINGSRYMIEPEHPMISDLHHGTEGGGYNLWYHGPTAGTPEFIKNHDDIKHLKNHAQEHFNNLVTGAAPKANDFDHRPNDMTPEDYYT